MEKTQEHKKSRPVIKTNLPVRVGIDSSTNKARPFKEKQKKEARLKNRTSGSLRVSYEIPEASG